MTGLGQIEEKDGSQSHRKLTGGFKAFLQSGYTYRPHSHKHMKTASGIPGVLVLAVIDPAPSHVFPLLATHLLSFSKLLWANSTSKPD